MKTINELNDILCEQIDLLRKGKTTASNVNAISNASGKVVKNVLVQHDFAQKHGPTGTVPKFLELKADGTVSEPAPAAGKKGARK